MTRIHANHLLLPEDSAVPLNRPQTSCFFIPSSFVVRISSFSWISIHSCPFVAKKRWRLRFDEVRQRFRLTPTEKRVAVFILAALVLGLITKCYRDAHPRPPESIDKNHPWRQSASAATSPRPKQKRTRLKDRPTSKRDAASDTDE